MQIIHVELTELAPDAVDRLITTLQNYLSLETSLHPSEDIHLEVRDLRRSALSLPSGSGGSLYVPFAEIRYVTADRHWSVLRLTCGSRRIRMNFSEITRRLPAEEFLCCSRGILLNLRHIQSADRDCFLMDDGTSFPLRREGRRSLLLRWDQYRLDHGNG